MTPLKWPLPIILALFLLTQRLLAELYQVGVNTINHQIKEIYEDRELLSEQLFENIE